MIRRIVGCQACQSRFVTLRGMSSICCILTCCCCRLPHLCELTSHTPCLILHLGICPNSTSEYSLGSVLCLECRPKINEAKPPELTYGGKRIRPTTTTQQQNAYDANSPCDFAVDSSKKIDVGDDELNDSFSHFEHVNDAENPNDDERIDTPMEIAPEATKKRRLSTILVTSADGCINSNTDFPLPLPTQSNNECDASDSGNHPRSPCHAKNNHDETEMQEGEVHVAKKQRVEEKDHPSWGDANIIHSGIDGTSNVVSIVGSTYERNHNIQQEIGEEVMVGVDDTTNPRDDENDDDDSDIVWLGTSPSNVPKFDYGTYDDAFYAMANSEVETAATLGKSEYNASCEVAKATNDFHGDEFVGSLGVGPINCEQHGADNIMHDNCASSEDNASDGDSKLHPTTMQLLPSPKKDVCYICGSDLSRLKTGLRGRVAHMKRCSAKNNDLAFGGCSARSNLEDLVDQFERSDDNNNEAVSSKNTESDAANPYNNGQWHNDAESDLKLNKSTFSSQPKQTVLKDFFKAPVKCLTSVLMAGARQVAKSEASIKAALATPPKIAKESNPNIRWGSNNRRNGSCPSYKRIPGTDFICDGFQFATRTLSENYFLTHFHSDVSCVPAIVCLMRFESRLTGFIPYQHYGGIAKNWSDGTIYCSLPTANLVHQQLRVEKKYLHPIPLNTPTAIASKGKSIIVTLFDANHCPGAVMFLFEIGNKKVLHVGDFRFNRQLMMQVPQLLAFSNGSSRLDEIFLDTTYCDTKYTLPTQDEAISAAIEVAGKEVLVSNKDTTMKTLFLFGSYTIGKEKIYMSVAEHLKKKVYVDSRRYQILSSFEWPNERMELFTTNKSDTNLWVVPLGSVNFKQMPDYLEEANKNKLLFASPYGRVVGFRPTGEYKHSHHFTQTTDLRSNFANQISTLPYKYRLDLQSPSKRTNYACSFNISQKPHYKQNKWEI